MLIDSFLDYLKTERNYSAMTIGSYEEDLRQFEAYLKEVDEGLDWANVDADVVRRWITGLMEKGFKATSVNRKLSTLRSFYRYLLIRGKVEENPLRKIKGPKKQKPLPVFVRDTDMDKLLDELSEDKDATSQRDRLILEMFYVTGMRRSELIGLNDQDVDFGASLIKVTGKRNKQRLIPFGEELGRDLQAYMQCRDAQYKTRATESLFVNAKGERMTPGEVYNLVKKNLSKVVTLKKRSPHVLRHTFATTMLNHSANIEVVKELLGHESLNATEVYTHATFEELKQIYKQAHPRA